MSVIKLHCRPSVSCLDPGALVVKVDITIGGKKMGGEGGGESIHFPRTFPHVNLTLQNFQSLINMEF
jgi:hypothetical protein